MILVRLFVGLIALTVLVTVGWMLLWFLFFAAMFLACGALQLVQIGKELLFHGLSAFKKPEDRNH